MIKSNTIRLDHKEQFILLSDQLSETEDIRAIFGFGSYFSNNFGPNSDIDILVLGYEDKNTKFKTEIKGLLFEVTLLSIKRLIAMLRQGHKVFVPAINNGTVLYDPIGKAQDIMTLANNSYITFAPKFSEKNRLEYSISRTNTIFTDMVDALEDQGLFELLFGQFIISLHFMVCMHKHYWTKGVKHTFDELISLLPEISSLLEQCFNNDTNANRLISAKQLNKTIHQVLNCQDLDIDALVLMD